jgi:hypothetical protein
MGLPVCQSWDHGHHLCVARRRFRRARGRTAAARPTRHAKCAPSAPRRPSPPCCTCGWSGPSFLQTSLSDRPAIGSSQPTQTPGCDGWRGLLRVHISRHRERRRHMAKPCCDHRGAIGPTPTPSRLAFAQPLALATTMASPVAHTTGQRRPSQAPPQQTGKDGQTSNYPPTPQQPRAAPAGSVEAARG